MMVITAKVKKRDIWIALAAIAIIVAIILIPGGSRTEQAAASGVGIRAETNEDVCSS